MDDLVAMREECEEIQERDGERLELKKVGAARKLVLEQNERSSFGGHIRLPVSRGSLTVFSFCTAAFLESHDLVKLMQLSKEYRREMLGKNASVFASRVYCGQIHLM